MRAAFDWNGLLGEGAVGALRAALGRAPWVSAQRGVAEALTATVGGLDARRVIAASEGRSQVWFHTRDGHHKVVDVPARTAADLQQSGMTVCVFDDARLQAACDALEKVLGVARGKTGAAMFAQSRGARTVRHYDPADILVVQLAGEKSWFLAPNREAPNPLVSCAENDPPPTRLAYYMNLGDDGLEHEDVSATEEEFRLEAGSVLYVPRGYWHSTTTHTDSMSVHFQLHTHSWLEVLTEMLPLMLVTDAQWREPAWGWSESRGDALPHLIPKLKALVERLEAADLVAHRPVTESAPPGKSFRRSMLASVRGEPKGDGYWKVRIITLQLGADHVTHVDLDDAAWEACKWIRGLAAGTTIHIQDVVSHTSLTEGDAEDLAAVLLDAGLLQRGTPSS